MSENTPRAKLTNQQVWDIRQRYINGESIKEIYQDFKDLYKNEGTFKRIVLGQTYKTVGNIPQKSLASDVMLGYNISSILMLRGVAYFVGMMRK